MRGHVGERRAFMKQPKARELLIADAQVRLGSIISRLA